MQRDSLQALLGTLTLVRTLSLISHARRMLVEPPGRGGAAAAAAPSANGLSSNLISCVWHALSLLESQQEDLYTLMPEPLDSGAMIDSRCSAYLLY